MRASRRGFLRTVAAGGVGAGAWSQQVFAAVPGARRPAPERTAPAEPAALTPLAASPVLAHEGLAAAALERAVKGGASYADARIVEWASEALAVREARVESVTRSRELGLAIRVLADGAWGFGATDELAPRAVERAVARALDQAKAGAALARQLGREPVRLAPQAPVRGEWCAPHAVDPFAVDLADKLELLRSAAARCVTVAGVSFARAGVASVREDKLLLTSEGTRTLQRIVRIMPSLSATAVDRRSGRFASRDHEVAPIQAGWEWVAGCGLLDEAEAIAEQARQKLHAAPVEPGPRQVILAPSNLWLTIHESIGHPTELDRALGLEANYAGTSFLSVADTGQRTIAAPIVNFVADRTQPGGLATTAWDDEGVPAQRWELVRDGVFVGWQTTREQAGWIGEPASRGCSYGQGFGGVAFQRMPNVSLQPGTEGYTTEDLINATEDGILISGRGSWSIDQQRYNFQFGGQFFWEIKRGRLTRPLRDVAYQANSIEFWRSCDLLGGEGTYRLGGSFSDGKGEPSQSNAVSHGCVPARFRVEILNTGAAR